MSCEPIEGTSKENITDIRERCIFGMNFCILPGLLKTNSIDDYINECINCFFSSNESIPGSCPPLFDYYTCWTSIPNGESTSRICPQHFNYFNYFNIPNQINKSCHENGTWDKISSPGYLMCLEREKYLAFHLFVRNLNISGHFISALSLCASLLIFYNFRSLLRSTRTKIHVQLFLSFMLTSITSLIWDIYIMDFKNFSPILHENPTWCQLLHTISQTLITSNYFWMFCEGLYLYLALKIVFISGKNYMRLFYYIGWVFPTILVFVYALLRKIYGDQFLQCGNDYSPFEKIITIPITISVCVNCLVFVLILKRTCCKFNVTSDIRKAAKSVLVLVILLGVHHIFFMYPSPEYPQGGGHIIFYYLHFLMQTITSSFQGFAVACRFCFENHDVQSALKSAFRRTQSQNNFTIFGKPYFQVLFQKQNQVFEQKKERRTTTVNHGNLIIASTTDV